MKKLLVLFASLLVLNLNAQTCRLKYDFIELYDWTSGWATGFSGNYYTNAFVSSNASAALIGLGSGTSAYELGYYVLPNVTFLDPTYAHRLTFRLASYRFGNPTAATSGVDLGDYVEVQVSTNGGATYIPELRITGNNNALWTYASTAAITKTTNGVLTTVGPAGGGDRTTLGDGYSFISVTIPAGATQAAFYIFCRANAAGEEWWIDNIEFTQLGPCPVLAIELISFGAEFKKDHTLVSWLTATEVNNNYFTIERSIDALNWIAIADIPSEGNSNTPLYYEYKDYKFEEDRINYYRLKQTDYSGEYEYFDIVQVDTKIEKPTLIKITNIFGDQISDSYIGIQIYLYSDGSYKKIIKLN